MAASRKRNAASFVVAFLLFVATLVCLMIGLGSFAAGMEFRRHAAKADGVVTATPNGGSHPEIAFPLPSGQVVHFQQNGMIAGYRTGDRVQVLFDPASPQLSACIDSIGALMGGGAFALGFALITLVLGSAAVVQGLTGIRLLNVG